ncbi:MAG: DUF4325 domain-containing protein [Candidatus Omnitrophica bacterium]|nr:DUF4325 domain-containing protein [Candidatus Omnitrophota bacterium]
MGKNKELKVSDVIKATGFSRAYINRFLQTLRNENKIILIGKANKARYVLAASHTRERAIKSITSFHRILSNKNLSEDIVLGEIKKNTGIFLAISGNVSHVIDYAFTEMLNNAIEHSRSKTCEVIMVRERDEVYFHVIDKGIGIFNNIRQKKHLNTDMEAIQDLLKGKLSTDPKAHTGEGIFFTSRVADMLIIQSGRKKLIFNNLLNDVFIKDVKNYTGTKVDFKIRLDSHINISNVFKQYTGDSFEFSKTKVVVKLYRMGNEYISRSQARRILSSLEKFKVIILDFKDVDTVGQGFVDEVFRVWKDRYPAIEIIPHNSNENINFMINRAKAG